MRFRLVSLLPAIALSASLATVGLTPTPALASSDAKNPAAKATPSLKATPLVSAGDKSGSMSGMSENTQVTHPLSAASGPTSKVIGWGFNNPQAVASDGTHLWVANYHGNSVTELNLSDGSLVRVISGSSYGFNYPAALASDGTHLWVANLGGDSVTELNLTP